MSFKVKDHIICQVETRTNGTKAVLSRKVEDKDKLKLESREFEIIATQPAYPGAEEKIYTIAIDDNMVGWIIGEFHIEHWKVNPKFKGRRFWDLYAEFMEPISKEKSDLSSEVKPQT